MNKWHCLNNVNHYVSFLLLFSLILCSGCDTYDWLVNYIQRAFASDYAYDVSVVDCKHLQKPNALFNVDSALSKKLNAGVRQGVADVGTNVKYRNIKLSDNIPKEKFQEFHDEFFADNKTYEERTEMLRKYCEMYKTNIIICGATMGDDYDIVFIGWLYRRDLDVISQTEVQHLKLNTSERVQEKIVQDSIKSLLERSLDEDPIGVGGKIGKDLADNKEEILLMGKTVLLQILSGALM